MRIIFISINDSRFATLEGCRIGTEEDIYYQQKIFFSLMKTYIFKVGERKRELERIPT